jgi:bacterioferritin (cytochrome b1)
LKGQLIGVLDLRTESIGTKQKLQALVRDIVSSHRTGVVQDCLAEIQRDCDEQIAALEHRLGMLVEVQAEIYRQRHLPDPLDLLSSYRKRPPPR